ncbi:MAG: hypothetical protein QOD47_603 [Gemmatimonadaceae bacterium]|nr:hypothetical protein [Gemmatimonadaceae bacterium]
MVAKSLLHLLLGDRNQLANVLRCGFTEIDHDVRMDVRNLSVTMTESLQTDFVDKAPRTHTLDFLEDRARTRVILEPRVLATTPAEVFLHYPVHDRLVSPLELKSDRERDVPLLVERAGVVTELHIVPIDGLSSAIVSQQLRRFKDLRDEHGSFSLRGGREKVQVLPDRSTDRTGNTDVVLETRKSALDSLRYQPRHHCPTLHPEPAIIGELQMTRSVPNHKAAESLVADEDVGAEPEHEVLHPQVTSGGDSPCQILGRCCIVEEIGWTADPERGVLSKWLISLESRAVESSDQLPVSVRAGFPRI